jgi:FeS assembly protein IscX
MIRLRLRRGPVLRDMCGSARRRCLMTLSWETTYAVAVELKRHHPGLDLHSVTLQQICDWTLALPGFEDDPALCNDEILASIFQDWFEETLNDGE